LWYHNIRSGIRILPNYRRYPSITPHKKVIEELKTPL
jgi:hypothetical protein